MPKTLRHPGQQHPNHVLAIVTDAHSCHAITEELLDVWWRSLAPEKKAELFESSLDAEPEDRATQIRWLGMPRINLHIKARGLADLIARTDETLDVMRRALHDEGIPSPEFTSFLELERSLAYEQANGIIDGLCCPFIVKDDEAWWNDTGDIVEFHGAAAEVADAVRYLDQRGLIERHPDHPNWVQVRDEAEPGTPVLPTPQGATP